ncbi:flagellar basal body-associated FliL family protein [Dongshaea marina]|uniref:flagellar basal body-associated FliL family protein n=1 Tax=Dongshaea marina TaxID=2047966 RepID=UPI001F23EB57|nr:flagellar basal body-associated FliL family protein [Dongshaea marina]
MKAALFSFALLMLFAIPPVSYVYAEEEVAPAAEETSGGKKEYAYFAFRPDIITNYISRGKHLGYVRVTVEVMVDNKSALAAVETHEPLLRDALIKMLGSLTATQARSLKERELFRLRCKNKLNELLVQETGKKLISELLFTKYIYQ